MRNSGHYNDPTAHRAITRVMREAELEKMDSLRRKPVTLDTVSEAQEQTAVMTWARYNERRYPMLKWLHHIPNGGMRSTMKAVRLKAEGVRPGVSDLCLPVPRGGYHGMYIEMKRPDHSNGPTSDQKDWLDYFNRAGYRAVVCYGYEEAVKEIQRYYGVPESEWVW